jgi:hypothetical protein
MNRFRTNIYRFSWAVLFGQVAFLLSLIVAELFQGDYEVRALVAGSLVTIPLFLLAGWIFAKWSCNWRRFHLFCLIVGGCLTPVLVSQAVQYYRKSVALRGTGFLAGLGEAISSGFFLYLSVGSLCLFIAGTTATWNGWRFSLRTLLVGMTCAAATLGIMQIVSR